MSLSPKVSVIILSYNHAASIGRAIESVLAAGAGIDMEIIIGDDASTDNTREICLDYARRYPDTIHLMPETPNKGVVNNYFDCLEAARGKYITDCAGDDYWHPFYPLTEMIEILDNDQDVAVVFGDSIMEWPDGSRKEVESIASLTNKNKFSAEEMLLASLHGFKYLPYVLSSALYRRSIITDALASNPKMVRNKEFGIEDVPIMAALASQGGAVYLKKPASIYVQQPESVSHSGAPLQKALFYSRVLECNRQLALHYGVPLAALSNDFNSKSRFIAGNIAKEGSDAQIEHMSQLIKLWPLPLPISVRINLWCARHPMARKFINFTKRILGR